MTRQTLPREPANVGPAVPVDRTTRVAEFNDLDSVEEALRHRDVACVITEPALTNIGIVLPDDGFLAGLRELCDRHGTLLLIDETHTFSAGPGGMTAEHGLQPDIVVIGKSIAGGVPIGAYGISAELAERVDQQGRRGRRRPGRRGRCRRHAGGQRAVAGRGPGDARAGADRRGVRPACARWPQRFTAGVQETIDRHELAWSVVPLGARTEYRFCSPAPRTGTESAAAEDPDLEAYLHLALLNRGVLLTPFHNMALMCPATTEADVDLHTREFAAIVGRRRVVDRTDRAGP